MTNPTSNFGWQMPTNTDLVTDLPADFAVFGQAVDTSMADLLGGTTGQILAKNSATNMDFVWINNDQGDITGVTAGTGITVTSPTGPVPTVSIDTATTVDKTTAQTLTNKTLTSPVLTTPSISNINAKGDILVGTADNTLGIITAGSNGETLVADSTATTGLRYQAPKTQNALYNSGFDIAQRGTSFTALAGADYTLDRWVVWSTTASQSNYASQQSIGNLSVTPNQAIRYCMRVGRTSGTTNTGARQLFQTLETSDSVRFAGQTVTVSFYARAGANYSQVSSQLNYGLQQGTGTDQIYYSFTGSTAVTSGVVTLTTSWQRFTYTGTVNTTTTQLAPYFSFSPTGTAGAADYFEVTGYQLEVGSVATPFNRMSGTIQGELAACQRYYYRNAPTVVNGAISTGGFYFASTGILAMVPFPVTMRTIPSSIDFANLTSQDSAGSLYAISAAAISSSVNNQAIGAVDFTVSGATSGRWGYVRNNNSSSGYLGFSAEL